MLKNADFPLIILSAMISPDHSSVSHAMRIDPCIVMESDADIAPGAEWTSRSDAEPAAPPLLKDRAATLAGETCTSQSENAGLIGALRKLTDDFEEHVDTQNSTISSLRSDIGNLRLREDTHMAKILSLEAALRKAVEKNVAGTKHADELNRKISDLESAVSASTKEAQNTGRLLRHREEELANVERRLSERNNAARQTEKDLSSKSRQISELQNELELVKRQSKLLKADADRKEVQLRTRCDELVSLNKSISEAKGTISGQQQEIVDLKVAARKAKDEAATELENCNKRMQTQYDEAESKYTAVRDELANLKNLHDASTKENSELKQSLRHQEAVSKENDELNATNLATVAQLREELAGSANLSVELRHEIDSLNDQLSNLQDTCTNYASAIALATHQLATVGPSEAERSECSGRSAHERTPLSETQLASGDIAPAVRHARRENSNVGKYADAGSRKSSFKFRVDVPAFEPGNCPTSDVVFGPNSQESENVPDGCLSMVSSEDTQTKELCSSLEAPFFNLFWCPPGTTTKTLVRTVHPEGSDVRVIDVNAIRWADGALMWMDILFGLHGSEGDVGCAPAEDSQHFWSSLESLFFSLADFDSGSLQCPILFVLRGASSLSAATLRNSMGGVEMISCDRIIQFIELLFEINDELVSGGLFVSVVLEGWQSSIPLGRHFVQSLALPRVSRRSGKRKNRNARRERIQISL